MNKGSVTATTLVATALTAAGLMFSLFAYNVNTDGDLRDDIKEVEMNLQDKGTEVTKNTTNIDNIKDDVTEIKTDVKTLLRTLGVEENGE